MQKGDHGDKTAPSGGKRQRSGSRPETQEGAMGAAQAQAAHGAARGQQAGMEDGICILCGGEKKGGPAKKDIAIAFARGVRRLLRMEEHHTVACSRCIDACRAKRAAFEAEMKTARIFALIFFAGVCAGGFYFKSAGAWIFVPAALGSAIILLLPYGKYFPKFG